MISIQNIWNLIQFRSRLFIHDLGLGSARFYAGVAGNLFGIAFFFITLFTLLAFNKDSYIAIVALLPLLLQLSFGQQSVSKFNPSKSLVLSQFIKNTPITLRDRAIFTILHDIFFSLKFWIGLFFSYAFSLLFFKSAILVALSGITIYLISFMLVNSIFDTVQYLTLHKLKVIRGIGFVLNILISILPVLLFISLFSMIGGATAQSFLVSVLQHVSLPVKSLTIFQLILFIISLLVMLILYYSIEYFNVSKLYFYDNERKQGSIHISKPGNPKSLTTLYSNNPLLGILKKDIQWISKFPGIFLQFFYPLLFIIIASKFLLRQTHGLNTNIFETFYIIIAVGNLNFLLDNQLSIYAKFFTFDLHYRIKVVYYFLSKYILSFSILAITLGAFVLLNKYLDLGYILSVRVIMGFFFYVVVLNIKGIYFSIFEINAFDYVQGQLKIKRSGCLNSIIVMIVNLIVIIPLFLILILNIPVIFILLCLFFALILYGISLFIASKLFEYRYHKIVESFGSN